MFKMILETIRYYGGRPKPGRYWRVRTLGDGGIDLLPTAARHEMYTRIQRARFSSRRNMTVFRLVFLSIMRLRSWRRNWGRR